MVFQKRSSSKTPRVPKKPKTPRVTKSARGKRSIRKKESPDQTTNTFDLLATIAVKLLDEGECSLGNMSACSPVIAASGKEVRVKQEHCDEEAKHSKNDVMDQESALISHIAFQRSVNHHDSKGEDADATHALNEVPKVKSEVLDKEPSMISCTKVDLVCNFGVIADKWSPESVESGAITGDAASKLMVTTTAGFNMNAPGMYNLLDSMDVDVKPPPLVSSDNTGEMPLYGDKIRRSISFPRGPKGGAGHGVDTEQHDDDDKSSGCTHSSTATNRGLKPNRTANHSRVKKLLACKYRKLADLSYSEIDRKLSFRNKKMHYTRQRTQSNTLKRRKLLDRRSTLVSDGFTKSNARRNTKVPARDSHAAASEVNRGKSSMPFHKSCAHVKLKIKSFKVPELLIEIPETASVGALKKMVLEAVSTMLEGGLRVGVLHHGKMVRGDNKTLVQAGIAHGDLLDNLGFSLEPNCTQHPSQLSVPEDIEFLGTVDTKPLARITPADSSSELGEVDASRELALTPLAASYQGNDHVFVHSPRGISSADKPSTNSRAIVPVTPADSSAGAVVSADKAKRVSEQGQRRIRRPFSVAEVEALVLAVEKLGTGKWRDVKLYAFGNAMHRTYVDLKDKWKTLVHTASISPQQRRGEPVPQDLLDRVLAAQSYWSQQQAKLQPKTPPLSEATLLT